MRWFILFLLVANVILFFWMQHDARHIALAKPIPPPDVGQLQLVNEPEPQAIEPVTPIADPVIVSSEKSEPLRAEVPEAKKEPAEQSASERLSNLLDKAVALVGRAEDPEPASLVEPETAAEDVQLVKFAEVAVAVAEPAKGSAASLTDEGPQEVAAAPAEKVVESCSQVGPLLDKDAETLLANLPGYLELISDITKESEKVEGYYVMVPPLPSREAGVAKVKELRRAGFTDILLLRKARHRNAISMGVFSRKASATRHAASIAKKDIDVEVVERTSLRQMRWLKLRNSAGGAETFNLPLPKGASVMSQPCP